MSPGNQAFSAGLFFRKQHTFYTLFPFGISYFCNYSVSTCCHLLLKKSTAPMVALEVVALNVSNFGNLIGNTWCISNLKRQEVLKSKMIEFFSIFLSFYL
jgi:hypothetical protein